MAALVVKRLNSCFCEEVIKLSPAAKQNSTESLRKMAATNMPQQITAMPMPRPCKYTKPNHAIRECCRDPTATGLHRPHGQSVLPHPVSQAVRNAAGTRSGCLPEDCKPAAPWSPTCWPLFSNPLPAEPQDQQQLISLAQTSRCSNLA